MSNGLLRESVVYTFYVKNIHAIKVGFGADGFLRMKNYSKQYLLEVDNSSLRQWTIPASSLASAIETACHNALMSAGFHRLAHIVDEKEAQELFELGTYSYDEAVLFVAGAIEETIIALTDALSKNKPLTEEFKKRKAKELADQRELIRQEKERRDQAEEDKQVELAIAEIKQRWESEVIPFIEAKRKAKRYWQEIMDKKIYNQNFLDKFINGKPNRIKVLTTSPYWSNMKQLSREILLTGRHAKNFYITLKDKYGKYADKAAEKLGYSLWNPGGDGMPFVGHYSDENGMAYLEVRLCVQDATGTGGDDAMDLIRLDPFFQDLINFAKNNPPPELGHKDFQGHKN